MMKFYKIASSLLMSLIITSFVSSCTTQRETTGAKWGAIWSSRLAAHRSEISEGNILFSSALRDISPNSPEEFSRTFGDAIKKGYSKSQAEGREVVLSSFISFMGSGPTPLMVDSWFNDKQRVVSRAWQDENDKFSAHFEIGKKDVVPDGYTAERIRLVTAIGNWDGAAEELSNTWKDFSGWKSDMAAAAQQDADEERRMSYAMMMFGAQMRQQSMAQQQMMQSSQQSYQKPIQCNSYKVGNSVQTNCY